MTTHPMEHQRRAASLPLVLPVQGSAVPAHSRYQAGDWVRVHGVHNAPAGLRRDGWRGFVTGYAGGTLLVGLTDDGRAWAENWGGLEPDQPRPRGVFDVCNCCPRTELPGEQPALFDLPAAPLRNGDIRWWRQQYDLTWLAASLEMRPPAVVWALLEGVQIDDESGWDGSNGMPPAAWHDSISYDEYRRRRDTSRKVRRMASVPDATGYLVGRYVITPKQKSGGDWRECWWNGEPEPEHALSPYGAQLVEGQAGIEAAKVFPSRTDALRALMWSLRGALQDRRRRDWALEQLNRSFIVAREAVTR